MMLRLAPIVSLGSSALLLLYLFFLSASKIDRCAIDRFEVNWSEQQQSNLHLVQERQGVKKTLFTNQQEHEPQKILEMQSKTSRLIFAGSCKDQGPFELYELLEESHGILLDQPRIESSLQAEQRRDPRSSSRANSAHPLLFSPSWKVFRAPKARFDYQSMILSSPHLDLKFYPLEARRDLILSSQVPPLMESVATEMILDLSQDPPTFRAEEIGAMIPRSKGRPKEQIEQEETSSLHYEECEVVDHELL